MAAGATVHVFTVQLSDSDRGVYESFELRLARHPSETAPFMLTRVLAYALEFGEGIALSSGVDATEEPAVYIRDLTGRLLAWIEVGTPEAARLHKGAKQAPRCAVYSHRDPSGWLAQIAGEKIHRAAELPVYSFDRGFVEQAAAALQRRSALQLTVTGRHLYLEVDGKSYETPVHEQRLG